MPLVPVGNSLGPLPKGVTERVTHVIEQEWGKDLITSWNINGWIDHPGNVGDKIGSLVGGGEGNVVVCDSTSVNLFKALGAGLALRPGRNVIISEDGNFPTDLYMIQGMLALLQGSARLFLHASAHHSLTRSLTSSSCVSLLAAPLPAVSSLPQPLPRSRLTPYLLM